MARAGVVGVIALLGWQAKRLIEPQLTNATNGSENDAGSSDSNQPSYLLRIGAQWAAFRKSVGEAASDPIPVALAYFGALAPDETGADPLALSTDGSLTLDSIPAPDVEPTTVSFDKKRPASDLSSASASLTDWR